LINHVGVGALGIFDIAGTASVVSEVVEALTLYPALRS